MALAAALAVLGEQEGGELAVVAAVAFGDSNLDVRVYILTRR